MRRWSPLVLVAACAFFLVAAILGAGGYRYGASDQAFYVPALLHHLDAGLFPRDWALLGPQDHLNVFTAAAAALVRWTGFTIPTLFLVLHLAGLAVLFLGVYGVGSRLYRSSWTMVALAAALTLRHAVAAGAVNTLEGYMHPRMLAFAVGTLALAACLGRHPLRALVALSLALAVHPTTGIWFAVWVGVALAVADPRFKLPVLAASVLAAAFSTWAIVAGPLAGRLAPMDDAWLSLLASKKYLFPGSWSIGSWVPAMLTPVVAAGLYALRAARGLVGRVERGVAAGAAVLFAIFLASLPFTAARLALAVQLQVPRVLWMVDLLAVVYLVWFLSEGAPWARLRPERAARAAAIVFLAASLGRGVYVTFVEHADRGAVSVGLPANDWTDTMRWVEAHTPKDAWVLAPPGHAWKYGTSVRIAAQRDVFLEEAKDPAMGLYSRAAAMTVLQRIEEAGGFDDLSADSARSLAAATGPDILVSERRLALPLLHEAGRFAVYRLK
jgi:hypothetical protein